jgi:ubiquinol-cytochrome c reductase cytochrome b subunit
VPRYRRVLDWLEERTGYRGVLRKALDEPIPGGASWAFIFGSVLTFLLLLQMVTGVLLAMTYSPSVGNAWASVAYIQDQASFGWFLRGLHHHGASAMVIVAGLHMLQVAVYGAYKRPREVNWFVGVMLLGLILAFALTGYLLPWDQKGYWATKVATSIMGSTPFIGRWLQELVQGGNEYGNLTLTRFYSFHVFLLPALTLLLVAIHVALFRKHGVTPRWDRSPAYLVERTQPFWPNQLLRDMVAITVTFAAMVVLTVQTGGAPLEAPADPSSSFDARPEWYFLPLFQMLKYFSGPMEQVAALGIPALVGVVLFALPFVDRRPGRSPRERVLFLSVVGVGFLAAGALIVIAQAEDARDQGLARRRELAEVRARKARALARQGVPPGGGVAVWQNDPAYQARRLWDERCSVCHEGPEREGPEITDGYNSRAWIRGFLLNPDGELYFARVEKLRGKMKPVTAPEDELAAYVEFVYAESGASDADQALATLGKQLFDEGKCSDCHSRDGASEGEGPNLGGRGTAGWFAAMIAEPGHVRFFGEKNDMPAFGAKLKPEELTLLADFLVGLRSSVEGGVSGAPRAP